MSLSIPSCPTWYDLRSLGRSPISRLTVLIPIFGSLIIFSSAADELLKVSAEFVGIDQELSVKITRRNIFFSYFGLLIFSLITISYNALAPSIIKEFSSEYSYYEAEYKIITKNRAHSIQEILEETFGKSLNYDFSISQGEADAAARALGLENRSASENREFWLRAKSDSVNNLLQESYSLHNNSRLGQRRFVYIGYIFSFALIAYPSAAMLYRVTRAIF